MKPPLPASGSSRSFGLFARASLLCLALLGILALGLPLLPHGTVVAAPDPTPTWFVDAPVLFRGRAEPYDHYAVKDPTVVYSGGRYLRHFSFLNGPGHRVGQAATSRRDVPGAIERQSIRCDTGSRR
jgi:hypothetical protein